MTFDHVPPQLPTHRPCKVAFVGEAPSYEEIYKGQPLVGPSGRIFNAILRTAGLRREDYLITNVFDEQLPSNNVANWCMDMREARTRGALDLPPIGPAGFLRKEHRWHLERLKKELEECQPTVVVPLGGTALWAFTGETNITAQRGAPRFATRVVPGVKLLPTFHPSYIMKVWKFFHVVTGDFQRAAMEAERGPHLYLPERNLLLEPTYSDLMRNTDRLLGTDLLSVDIETGWGQITCIGFAPSPEWAICVPFVDLRRPNHSYWSTEGEECLAWKWVEMILSSPTPKLGQNFGAYDAYWLLQRHLPTRNLRADTRLLSHAIYPELPKSLAFMGASFGTQGAWKEWGKRVDKRDN